MQRLLAASRRYTTSPSRKMKASRTFHGNFFHQLPEYRLKLTSPSTSRLLQSSTSGIVEVPETTEMHDISLNTKEGIEKVEKLIKQREGFRDMEHLIYIFGKTQGRFIYDRCVIPKGVKARLCVVDEKFELMLYDLNNAIKQTGMLLEDAVAISDAQEETTYHPCNDLSDGISRELSMKYNSAFTKGLQDAFLDTKDISKHQLYYTLLYVYFGRS